VGLRFILSEIAELVARRKRGISLLARMKKKFQQLYEPVHYLAPVEYIEKQLAKICSPMLPVWSVSTCY
jgi:hypothetical protein